MIEKTQSFKISTGEIFPTLEIAQKHELAKSLDGTGVQDCLKVAETIIANRAEILAILGKKPRKPRAAKPSAPATKKRAAKTQPELPAA
jgi:hypothetical protein